MKHKEKILLVKSDNDLQGLFTARLERAGYNVYRTHFAQEALDILNVGVVPDVAILDLEMDDGSGAEILHTLHHSPPFENTRVIVVATHNAIRKHKVTTYQSDVVLVKPVSPRHLNVVVGQQLDRTRTSSRQW